MRNAVWLVAFPIAATFAWAFAGAVVVLSVVMFQISKVRSSLRKVEMYTIKGVVTRKYVCFPRGDRSTPVLVAPKVIQEDIRKTGACELMVQINCSDGYTFAEWVNADMFDALEEGAPVLVTYSTGKGVEGRTHILIRRLGQK